MDAETYVITFWNRIDLGLKLKGVNMTKLASDLNIKRETIYTQKRRKQLPRAEQLVAMLDYLGLEITARDAWFDEYIPYLQKAEDWKIKAIRDLLGMPDKSVVEKKSNVAVG